MKKGYKILSLLCLCLVIGGILYKNFYSAPMTKLDFYAKYKIYNNNIIPQYFDMDALYKFMEQKYGKSQANEKIFYLQKFMAMPEQYDGFYKPQDKIIFYNAENYENMRKLELSDSDMQSLSLNNAEKIRKELTFNLTDEELKKHGYFSLENTAVLISRVGKNIYLLGTYTDCGTFGCPVDMYVRNNNILEKKNAHLLFDFCTPDEQKKIYQCDIVGGYDDDLRTDIADYLPLEKLYNRYYAIYADYVSQYLQRK